jgi:uncharacterized repeat protein (TIGR01451 family)
MRKCMINKKKLYSIALVLTALVFMLVCRAGAVPYAYITNYGDNEVAVIDTATKLITATVGGLHGPWGIAVTPNGKNVYVTNLASNNVSVIDTKTNTVTDQVPVGNWPYGAAVTPDGTKVYVTNYVDGTVSVIDTKTNTVTASVPVGSLPYGIAVTPDGAKVYVSNAGINTVSVINTKTNTVITQVLVEKWPEGVTVTPDGTKVYVANSGSNNISIINTTTNNVTATVNVGNWPYGVTVTPDGTKVYVTNQYDAMGNISVINTTNNAVTNILTNVLGVDSMLFGIAVTPNGKQVYAANYGGITSVINPSTNTVATTVPVGNNSVAFGQFIGKTAPTILWNNPANIVYGTPLSSTQLSTNASDPISGASLHGTFRYIPPLGTVLTAGMHTLQADFMPNDAVNYTTASAKVIINVVLTPVQKIYQMISFIQDLVTSYELSSQSGIKLISELQDTNEYLSHGYTDLAIVNLKNFIHQTKTDIIYGVLSPKNGTILIDRANDVIIPALTITKSAAPITYNAAGQPITYTYTVTNSGNVNLSDIMVTDTTLNQRISISNSSLVPGQSTKGTYTYMTSQTDVENDSVVNTATSSCIFNNNPVSNTTTATVNAVQSPALLITKTASVSPINVDTPGTYSAPGQFITYTYTVQNTGNVYLSNIWIIDDHITNSISISSSNLAPGQSAIGNATYSTTQSDIDNGSVVNTATSSCIFNHHPVSNTTTTTVNAVQRQAMAIRQSTTTNNPIDPTTYNAVGQTITYTYTVTNSGNVNITAPISVIDNKIATSPITIQSNGTLSPGNCISGTATYTITQADLDAGYVTNQAFATGSFNQVTINSINTATWTVKTQ